MSTTQYLGCISLLVREYDEALAYYTGVLGFELLQDTDLGQGRRWVLVRPPGACETALLLARAATPAQAQSIGRQAGGRVWLFLHTSDFWIDYRRLSAAGVTFLEEPRREAYGTVAVFEDCYGNKWDLLERV